MNHSIKKPRKISLYFVVGVLGLIAVLVGFSTTYITPSIRGTFKAPIVVHIHGAFAFCWVILFLIQAIAVKMRNYSLHKFLGYCTIFIATGIVSTMLPVGMFQVRRDFYQNLGDSAVSQIVGVLTTAIIFGALVLLGYNYRKKPKIHKRLFLLATIVLLWPAWFRFRHYFPYVPRPDIWFAVVLADSLIVVSMIVDRVTYGKVHPVLLYGGFLIMGEHILEVLMFDTNLWRSWGNAIYHVLAWIN
jgi:hypothetical protein